MRTEQEIKQQIENIEFDNGKLLDRLQESNNVHIVFELNNQKLRNDIALEQLYWVLNE